jgi:hypothetical protein
MSVESTDSSQGIYNSNCVLCSTVGVCTRTNVSRDRIG